MRKTRLLINGAGENGVRVAETFELSAKITAGVLALDRGAWIQVGPVRGYGVEVFARVILLSC
jgi:hypothetical protein